MSTLITSKDWPDTELGPPAQWPATLRVAVGIMLNSQFPMFLGWGPQLMMLYNDAYIPCLGNKHPAALGEPFLEVWHELWTVIEPLTRVVLADEATYQEDLLLVMQRSGSAEETYFTFSYSPIHSAEGPPAGLFCACTDTTARVIGERRLRTLRELGEISAPALPTAQEAMSAFVEVLASNRADVPHATAYLLDEDGSTARLAGSYGLADGSALTRPTLPDPDAEPAIWRVAAGGAAEQVTGLSERYASAFLGDAGPAGHDVPDAAMVLPITPAGAERPVAVLITAVSPYRELDADYRTFYELLTRQAVTAVTDALAYQAERTRVAALAELDRVKTEFFSNVSHEFRTPLTLMMGPVEQLRASVTDPRMRAELDMVRRNGLRLGKLVNTLLEFSRIQAGRAKARYEPVDLCAVTIELASAFRSAMECAGLVFEVNCVQLGEPVYVDREMWEKVVLNLLSNALKFTLEGSITVTLRRQESSVALRVADTGLGIPRGEMPRLFERFHRVEQARARSMEGSGIGLALVAELVAMHGGTITADSAVDAGTTFTVRLPLGHAHLPAEQVLPTAATADPRPAMAEPFLAEALRWLPGAGSQPEPEDGSDRDGSSGTKPGQVLVVDDNADMREYLGRLLASRHRIRAVGDGRAALEAARASPPDLVVSDVMMSGLDGLGLVAALRRDPVTAAVPVLLLSARAGQQASVEGLTAGADDYLVKPFSAQELLARVDTHVHLGRARRGAEQRFRALADATPALIWVDGTGAQREFVNRSWLAFTDADSPEADLGRRWRERIHPADRARYDEVRAAAEESDAPFEIEFRLRRGDGQYRWVLDRGAPLGSRERPAGYVGGCLDIDRRHRDRDRQRFLAEIGAALDEATTAQGRREVLVRTLVADGLVDLARLFEVGEDGNQVVRAIAANTAETQRLLTEIDTISPLAREVAATAEPRLAEIDDAYLTAICPDPAQRELRLRLKMRSVALVPLATRGRVVGLLSTARTGSSPAQTADDLALLVEIGHRAATALDNALLFERLEALHQEQREVAEILQRSLLPRELPGLARLAAAARYLPGVAGAAAGGDWYDLLYLGGTRVAIAVGDVVGQGPPAAAVMGQLRSALAGYLLEGHSPAAALERLDRFATHVEGALCSTCACLTLDWASGELCWSRAGHPPILLLGAGGPRYLDDDGGAALGVPGCSPYTEALTTIAPGASILLYTDGLIERRSEVLDEGLGRLARVASGLTGCAPDSFATRLLDGVLGDTVPDDDIALVVIRFIPGPLRARLPAEPAVLGGLRQAAARWAETAGLPAELAEDLQLTLSEAATNAVEHAYPGRDGEFGYEVGRLADGRIEVRVQDSGTWRPEPAGNGYRGHGLSIIHALAQQVEITRSSTGTEVHFVLPGVRHAEPVPGGAIRSASRC